MLQCVCMIGDLMRLPSKGEDQDQAQLRFHAAVY